MNDQSPPSSSGAGFQQPGPSQPDPTTLPLAALRGDLQISPQLYLGRTVYVIKDPVSLTYFRLQPPEHLVARRLDGRTNARQLSDMVNSRFPEQETTPEEVMKFVQMLQSSGMLLGRGERHGQFLRTIRDNRRRKIRRATWMNFLFIKVPVLDPDHLLSAMHSFVRPVMNRWFMWISILFMVITAATVILQIERVGALAMPVLGWQNLLLLSVVFFVVKVIHEFGHGLAAKHRGLEVHEIGVMFMAFLPLFYVDVSDGWMLPQRRDRLWVTAGGVFIEFLFASAAGWVWLNSEPGLANQIAFNIMLTASITTLVFNANPLLRYDGYYFLMDWLEVPNLKSKSSQYLGYLAKRYVLGIPNAYAPEEAARMPIFMPLFSVASGIYRWVVVFGIITLVWHILDPYGLKVVGALLAFIAMITMVFMPMLKLVRFVYQQQAKNWRRALATVVGGTGLVAVAWAILSTPLEQTIERPAVVLAPQRMPLYVPIMGEVQEVFIEDGQVIESGQPILRLANDDIEQRLAITRVELRQRLIERDIAMQRGESATVESLTNFIEQTRSTELWLEDQVGQMTILSPIRGRLHTPRSLRTIMGVRLNAGDALGMMIGEGDRTVTMIVPQADASLVTAGLPARARLWADARKIHHATVQRIGSQFIPALPHEALAGQFGGEVDTTPTQRYNTMPSQRSVRVELALHDPTVLMDGMTGRGKIVIEQQSTLGSQQWRLIRQAFSLDWWL